MLEPSQVSAGEKNDVEQWEANLFSEESIQLPHATPGDSFVSNNLGDMDNSEIYEAKYGRNQDVFRQNKSSFGNYIALFPFFLSGADCARSFWSQPWEICMLQ